MVSKKKKRVDLDVRPYPAPFWKNYDYGGPEEGESEVSPGRGLYSGRMDQYKSVKEFIEKSRKRMKKKRKQALLDTLYEIAAQDTRKTSAINIDYILKLASEYEDQWLEIIENKASENPLPFNDWFGEGDRVYIPFKMEGEYEPSDDGVQDVTRALKEYAPDKCQEIDFITGVCTDGRNKYRIGKLLKKLKEKELKPLHKELKELKEKKLQDQEDPAEVELDPEIISLSVEVQKREEYWKDMTDSFMNSPLRTRVTEKSAEYFVVLSQNPHDVAKMSTDRNWSSCMTLGSGQHYTDVFCEVADGGFIAYLIKSDDREIDDPLARIRIRRFTNLKGDSIAVQEDSMYGDDVPKFAEVVEEWINSKQKTLPGIYNLRGGKWSDTFSGSMVVPPDANKNENEDAMLQWLKAPQEVEGAIYTYWRVIDDMKYNEDEDAFEDYGALAGFAGDWPTEKIFDDEVEANEYAEIMNNSSWLDELMWNLDEQSQREFEDHAIYTGYSREQLEEAIERGDYKKHSEFGKYLEDDYKRFTVFKGQDDRTGLMQKSIINKVIDAPKGSYSPNLISSIKDTLFRSKNTTHEKALVKRFIEKFTSEFPEIADELSIEMAGVSDLQILSSAYKSLREGAKKEELGQAIASEIEWGTGQENIDKVTHQDWMVQNEILDRVDLLSSFDHVPENLMQHVLDFHNKIYAREDLSEDVKKRITLRIIQGISATKSDSPSLQKFYESLIPNMRVLPQIRQIAWQTPSYLSLDELGWAIAKLGENGRQFIPFFKEQINIVKNWTPSPDDNYHIPENASDFVVRKLKKDLYIFKRTQIEKIMYIIDALENGTGFSRKYNFFPNRRSFEQIEEIMDLI